MRFHFSATSMTVGFPRKFCELFPFLDDVPELDLQGKMGPTDYIDFVKPWHFKETFRKGTDMYQRKFFCYNYGDGVLTLFQRYTDQPDYWTHGGILPRNLSQSGGISFAHSPEKDERVELVRNAYLASLTSMGKFKMN